MNIKIITRDEAVALYRKCTFAIKDNGAVYFQVGNRLVICVPDRTIYGTSNMSAWRKDFFNIKANHWYKPIVVKNTSCQKAS